MRASTPKPIVAQNRILRTFLFPSGKEELEQKESEMLRGDLQAAGIPYVVEGPDGPLYADFHSLRHTYLTLGGRVGIDLRTLQELAGHHSPILTARCTQRKRSWAMSFAPREPTHQRPWMPVARPLLKRLQLKAIR